jgi:hypothetical protein
MFFLREDCTEIEILNFGLKFILDSGENWQKPIQEQLHKKLKTLSDEDLNSYNEKCKTIYHDGIKALTDIIESIPQGYPVRSKVIFLLWKVEMEKKYAWINKTIQIQLYKHANYYIWKEGLATGKIL